MYYIGLDVHKKTISFCVKDAAGHVHREGKIGSTRRELDAWIGTLPQPRTIAMEATIFSGWIYDHLLPHAVAIKVAHPLMLRAIAAAKKKNDTIDASKLADCLRCDFLPECHMTPVPIRDRRRILRYRGLVLRQAVQMKNRISGLLMETGVSYNKLRLHRMGYFAELLATNEEVSEGIRPLLTQTEVSGSVTLNAIERWSAYRPVLSPIRPTTAKAEFETLLDESGAVCLARSQ
jgi:transposase